MRRSKEIWYLLLFSLLIAAVAGLIMTVGRKEEKNSYTVSVIVNNSSDSRWTSLREGAEAAARDYNIRLNYVATGEFWGKQNELEIIYKELESGVDITPEEYYQTVGPDNKELGSALAERICQDFGENLTGKTIGILCGNTGQIALRQRLDGLEETLLKAGAKIQWKLAEMGRNPDKKLFEEKWNLGADIVIALENSETERAVDYMQENQISINNCVLYGVGNSEKAVYELDKGRIQALLVPNEFHMGYQSVKELATKLEYHTAEMRNVTTGYLMVDREHLYDAENQKILFPIVQ